MYQHDANAHLVEDRHLLDERSGTRRVGEYLATGLDDESLAPVEAHVGRGVAQRCDHDVTILRILRHVQAPGPII